MFQMSKAANNKFLLQFFSVCWGYETFNNETPKGSLHWKYATTVKKNTNKIILIVWKIVTHELPIIRKQLDVANGATLKKKDFCLKRNPYFFRLFVDCEKSKNKQWAIENEAAIELQEIKHREEYGKKHMRNAQKNNKKGHIKKKVYHIVIDAIQTF